MSTPSDETPKKRPKIVIRLGKPKSPPPPPPAETEPEEAEPAKAEPEALAQPPADVPQTSEDSGLAEPEQPAPEELPEEAPDAEPEPEPEPEGPKVLAATLAAELTLEEKLELSAYLDGELEEHEVRALESLLVTDHRRQAELASLREVAGLSSEAVPLPSEEAWDSFMDDLGGELAHLRPPREPLRPWRTLMAAAAAIMLTVVLAGRLSDPPVSLALPRLPTKTLAFAPVPWDGALDPSPLPELAQVSDSEAPIHSAARLELSRRGLVQVPAAGLTTLREPALAGPRPLATADASLLLYGAVSERAALSLEAGVLRPGLRELLALLDRELTRLEGHGESWVSYHAGRARARLAVANRLLGHEVELPDFLDEMVNKELKRVVAAKATTRSELLGRSLDYRLFQVRGLHAREASDHARAVTWLARAGFRVDPEDLDQLAQACLITLALSSGRATGQQSGLGLQIQLEAAVELLFGPPDDLTPSDVMSSMRQVRGKLAIRPGDLDRATLGAIAVRLEVEASARHLGRVRRPGPRRIVLLGSTRSFEGTVASRLTSPALPRPLPRSLDLFALLGSRRARTSLSALEHDCVGYDAALDALRPAAEIFTGTAEGIPLRASLERSRLGALATLVGPTAEAASRRGLAAQQSPAYRDRLLMAALAGLNGPGPSPERLASEAPGPLPLVEPLPSLHARLAFACRRQAEALSVIAPEHAAFSIRQLRRLARLEEALRDASLDVLAGRPVPEATQRELRALCPLFQAWVPREVRSVHDVYEVEDPLAPGVGVKLLQRAVFRVDRLYLVVPDPVNGVPHLGAGPALVATEVMSHDGPLRPGALKDLNLTPPIWASHISTPR
jgi:uncharacterized protein DUF3160